MSIAVTTADTGDLDRTALAAGAADPLGREAMRLWHSARWFAFCGGRNIATGEGRVHRAAFKLYKVRLREASRG